MDLGVVGGPVAAGHAHAAQTHGGNLRAVSPSGTSRICFTSRFQAYDSEQVVMEPTWPPTSKSEPHATRSVDSWGEAGAGVMLQSSARITALLIILSAGIAIPAAGAPKAEAGRPGHRSSRTCGTGSSAAPAPHAAAPKAAKPAPAAHAAAATARGCSPQAARQRHAPAQASTPRAAPGTARAERPRRSRAARAAAQEQPQTTGRNRDAREQPKLPAEAFEPKPRDDAARQPREGGSGPGPARAERNASPQNAPTTGHAEVPIRGRQTGDFRRRIAQPDFRQQAGRA